MDEVLHSFLPQTLGGVGGELANTKFTSRLALADPVDLREANRFVAAPVGLVAFMRDVVGTQDAARDAQALVAELASVHREVWEWYEGCMGRCLVALYEGAGLLGAPPHLAVRPPVLLDAGRYRSQLVLPCRSLHCAGRPRCGAARVYDMASGCLTCEACRMTLRQRRLLLGMAAVVAVPEVQRLSVWAHLRLHARRDAPVLPIASC